MNYFDSFIEKLLSIKSSNSVSIMGHEKTIVGMSRYATKNFPDGEYIKIVFHDHAIMVILIADQEIYFSESVIGKLESISDLELGEQEEITYKNQIFSLVNKQDYQYVIQKYIGNFDDIEGECKFSDYSPKNGQKEMLSLGIISSTGVRADVHCKLIKNEDFIITKIN